MERKDVTLKVTSDQAFVLGCALIGLRSSPNMNMVKQEFEENISELIKIMNDEYLCELYSTMNQTGTINDQQKEHWQIVKQKLSQTQSEQKKQ